MYTVKEHYVLVIGKIWMSAVTCAMEYKLTQYDIDNMKDEAGKINREDVEQWLCTHSGDFQCIADFRAMIDNVDPPFVSEWEHAESEYTFSECMYGNEVDV